MALQDAINHIQDLTGAVDGIRAAPDYPPEQSNVYPFCVAYMGTGEIGFDAGVGTAGIHSIVVELHVARKDLARDIAKAAPYVDSIPAALLADPTLGGTVELFENITYEFTPMQWDTVETVGFRFILNGVKQRSC